MNLIFLIYLSLFSVEWPAVIGEGCYKFNNTEENIIVLNVDPVERNEKYDYSITFRTTSSNSVLFYTEGYDANNKNKPYDYESLFIKNGFLNYFAFNPAPFGAGDSFGAHVKSNFTVSTGEWIKVNFFRNKEELDDAGEQVGVVTGFSLNKDGENFEFVSPRLIREVVLNEEIWLGGTIDIKRLSKHLSHFDGEISEFTDLSTDEDLFSNKTIMSTATFQDDCSTTL